MKDYKQLATHISGLCGVDCTVLTATPLCFEPTGFCSRCTHARCRVAQTHLYGCSEAYRWNGKYVYYCPFGLVFTAASVSDDNGALDGGLVAGPIVMGDPMDTLAEMTDEQKEQIKELPNLSTTQVRDLVEVMSAAAGYVAGIPHSLAGSFVYEQEKLLNDLYDARQKMPSSTENSQYLIQSEKQLHELIANGDKDGARALLNEILGYIYFSSDFELSTIKARIIELIVLLSRATIDAGADMNEILLCNTGYLQHIEQLNSTEELSVWITGIMQRFIRYSFDFTQVKHSDVVYKVMQYVRTYYDRKLSLDELANHVYLSRSYLSSVFHEETGEGLFSYINRVRVEKSKVLLLDNEVSLAEIAGLCGFEDQSYFTKVFKKTVGISPKRYRDSRGKISE